VRDDGADCLLAYAAGINTYEKACWDTLDGWKGFVVEYENKGKKEGEKLANGEAVDQKEQLDHVGVDIQ
jgi:hypothetical protein